MSEHALEASYLCRPDAWRGGVLSVGRMTGQNEQVHSSPAWELYVNPFMRPSGPCGALCSRPQFIQTLPLCPQSAPGGLGRLGEDVPVIIVSLAGMSD